MRIKKSHLISSLLLIGPLLFANSEFSSQDLNNPEVISNQMLVKPSTLNFETKEDSENKKSEDQAENNIDPREIALKPDFFSNLQANANLSNLPMPTNPADGANTWVPKFVWIGDVQKDDELKCFAAFLIGSLANKDGSQSAPVSPGVFMTPYTTTKSTEVKPDTQNYVTGTPQVASTPASKLAPEQMISRRSTSSVPQEMPVESRFYVETQYGLGFLYFAGVEGNFVPLPKLFYTDINAFNLAAAGTPESNLPIRGRIEYNRTVLWGADFGFRLTNWMYFAATFLTQQGVHIRTRPFQRAYAKENDDLALFNSNFEANLDLYSVGGKLIFMWPNMIKLNSWAMSLYFGGSAAGGWQSWTNVTGVQTYFRENQEGSADMTNANISFRAKYFPNFAYTGDAGLKFKPTNIFAKTSIKLGCKFLSWGSARGLGYQRDQFDVIGDPGNTNFGNGNQVNTFYYFKPLKIQTLYSWAPYFSFNWEF